MSLLVWMPLRGNTTNQGLANVTITTSGTIAFDAENAANNKMGQALGGTGSRYIIVSGLTLGSEASIACWTKTSTNQKMSWVLESAASNLLCLYENNIYTLNTGDSNNNPFKTDANENINVLHDGLWHHFVVTFGNSEAKLYIDGEYQGKALTFRDPSCTNSRIKIAGGYNNAHSYDWNGKINDFRVYNHCLSAQEIKEIKKALIVHFPFNVNTNTSGTLIDYSGYGNNGTISGTFSTDNALVSPRYSHYTNFNGSSYIYLTTNARAKIKDEISVGCWAYMSNWDLFRTKNYRLCSCTETGGWSLYPNGGTGATAVFAFLIGTGASSNTYKVAAGPKPADIPAGWHHFMGTYDGLTTKLYIDGELRGTASSLTTKTPIFYNANNSVMIGVEAQGNLNNPTGNKFNGKMSDFRIYASALSAEDVLDLYNTSAYIYDNGTVKAYSFDEVSGDNTICENGIIENDNFYEHTTYTPTLFTITGSPATFKPAANTDNSSNAKFKVEFPDVSVARKYVIEIDFDWTGPWAAGTGGTFSVVWQGSAKLVGSTTYGWSGRTNYITPALNNKQGLKALILANPEGGSYHYKTTFTIPANASCDGFWIGTRTNYSDGNGSYIYHDLKIYPYDMALVDETEKAKIGNTYITANDFQEI